MMIIRGLWRVRGNVLVGALFFSLASVVPLQPLSAAESEAKSIDRLIESLDAEDFGERQRAEAQLAGLGEGALEKLDKGMSGASPEQRARLSKIVSQIVHRALRVEFAALAKRKPEEVSMERGMWLISRILDPTVEFAPIEARLDELAAQVRKKCGGIEPKTLPPKVAVRALVETLRDDLKFGVNRANYDAPMNSSVAEVLKTGQGLQITLSEIAVAVGERLELPLVGVPVPRMYMFKYQHPGVEAGAEGDDLIVDPFGDWRIEDAETLQTRVRLSDPKESLSAYPPHQKLIRMLNNLINDLEGSGELLRSRRAREYRELLG